MLLESIQMSVVVAHGEEEGEDGSHHEGHQLCLGEARLALSTMRVPVSHVCHLKIRKYQTTNQQETGLGFLELNTQPTFFTSGSTCTVAT